MATHDGTWMDESSPITPGECRLKLLDEEQGSKYAVVDCASLPDPIPVDDIIRVNTPVQRSYKVTRQVAAAVDIAVRVPVVPEPYVAP